MFKNKVRSLCFLKLKNDKKMINIKSTIDPQKLKEILENELGLKQNIFNIR